MAPATVGAATGRPREAATTRARDLLRRKDERVVTIELHATVGEAVHRLRRHGIGGLPVVAAGGRLAGFLAERDVMGRMTRQRMRHLVVVEEGRLLGILSIVDPVKHRVDELETEVGVLRDYVAAHRSLA